MPNHLLVYVGVVVAIALLPGPDTAVVTKNALIHGREAALGSAIGVNVGLSVWTLATALGVAAILRSSATVYDALKLIGALYLVYIGARTLWESLGLDGAHQLQKCSTISRVSAFPRGRMPMVFRTHSLIVNFSIFNIY